MPESRPPSAHRDAQGNWVCELKSKIVYGPEGKTKVYECSQITQEEIIARTGRWLEIIGGAPLSGQDRDDLVRMTVQNFENFFNRGYVTYRKSVTEAGDFAALEWD